MPPHECTQEQQLNAKLADISEKLQLVLVQQNEIKNINTICARLENWLKDHEHRIQTVEGSQKACEINTVSRELKAVREQLATLGIAISKLKQAPARAFIDFSKAVVLLAVGAGFAWLAKG